MRCLIFVFFFLLLATPAYAHQPRIVFGTDNSAENPVAVEDPEISKAYYGILDGDPDYYLIEASDTFVLYLNLLAPDLPGSRTDFNVTVNESGNTIVTLDGASFDWQPYFEEFARDDYLLGPEYEQSMPAGSYTIMVSNPDNRGKYSLAIGKIESFPLGETIKTFVALPKIKSEFFEKSPISAYANIFGLVLLVSMGILATLAYALFKRYGSC